MSENQTYRLQKVCKELNVGLHTAVEYLGRIGIDLNPNPNERIGEETYPALKKEFKPDTLKDLELKLQHAIETENYEMAALLLKEIKPYKTGEK